MTAAQKLAIVFVLGVVAVIAAAPFSKQRTAQEQVGTAANTRLPWREASELESGAMKTLAKPIQELDVNVLASIATEDSSIADANHSPNAVLPAHIQNSMAPPELPAQFDRGHASSLWPNQKEEIAGTRSFAHRVERDSFLRPPLKHIVRDGDTLISLAEKYLGDPQRYIEIVDANRGRISQSSLLPIGMEIVIPRQ